MSSIIQNFKKKLIEQGQFKKYLLYALGEVIIIISGVLVAVQINNWNNLKISDEIFKSQLDKLYNELLLERGNVMISLNAMESQMVYIDKLLAGDNSVKDYEFPYLIFMMDVRFFHLYPLPVIDFELNSIRSDRAKQNLIYAIDKFTASYEYFKPSESYGDYIFTTLRNLNIPSFDYSKFDWQSFYTVDKFNSEFDPEYYSEQDIKKVKECINTPYVQGLLKTNKVKIKRDIVDAKTFLGEISKTEYELKKFYPEIGLNYDDIGIIGSSLPYGWDKSVPMTKTKEIGIWEITLPLRKGEVKFRANDSWVINWGGNSFPKDQCIPHGIDIQVQEGNYHIILNLKTQEYSFERINL